jgi:hypothetical protein
MQIKWSMQLVDLSMQKSLNDTKARDKPNEWQMDARSTTDHEMRTCLWFAGFGHRASVSFASLAFICSGDHVANFAVFLVHSSSQSSG